MADHHREAETMRGIDGEQLVGDSRDRFAHGDNGIDIGPNGLFRSGVISVTTVVWDGVPPNNRRVSV